VLPVRVDRCDVFVGMAFENLRLAMGMGVRQSHRATAAEVTPARHSLPPQLLDRE